MNRTKIANYFSYMLPIFVFLFAWTSIGRMQMPYRTQMVRLVLLSGVALIFLVVSVHRGVVFRIHKSWWLVIPILLVMIINLVASPNFYASFSSFLYFASLGILFFILSFGFQWFINPEPFVFGIFFVSLFVMGQAVFEVLSVYLTWWRAVGFLQESVPYIYRVNSLFGLSNVLMAFLNIILPLVIIWFFRSKITGVRIFLVFWIILYLAVIYFSSSRGGYVGAAASLSALLVLNLKRFDILSRLSKFSKNKKILIIFLVFFILLITGWLGFEFLIKIGSHPTHGGDTGTLNFNRTGIWNGYINVWKENKIFGSGMGRHPLEYLAVNRNSPPDWWPTYSHGMLIGILAEYGLVGAIPIFLIFGVTAWNLCRRYVGLSDTQKLVGSGLLAGIISISAHSLFDDFLRWPTIISFTLILLAWYLSIPSESDANQVHVNKWVVLGVVVGFLIAKTIYLSPYRFVSEVNNKLTASYPNYNQLVEIAERTIKKSPNNHVLLTWNGFINFRAGIDTGEERFLRASNEYLRRSLEIEPGISVLWMNKALVSWMLGNDSDAVQEAKEAIWLAPKEPIYPLNLGIFYEDSGSPELAIFYYKTALAQSTLMGWETNPFWSLSAIRTRALEEFKKDENNDGLGTENIGFGFLRDYKEALKRGDLALADKIKARANYQADVKIVSGLYAISGLENYYRGDPKAAIEKLVGSMWFSYNLLQLQPHGWWDWIVYQLVGWDYPFLDGVVELSIDMGQFDLVEDLIPQLKGNVREDSLYNLCMEYQKAVSGGALNFDSVPLPSGCE